MYYNEHRVVGKGPVVIEEWNSDLYVAREFETYPEAETRLTDGCNRQHWGGFFQIEKVYINR